MANITVDSIGSNEAVLSKGEDFQALGILQKRNDGNWSVKPMACSDRQAKKLRAIEPGEYTEVRDQAKSILR